MQQNCQPTISVPFYEWFLENLNKHNDVMKLVSGFLRADNSRQYNAQRLISLPESNNFEIHQVYNFLKISRIKKNNIPKNSLQNKFSIKTVRKNGINRKNILQMADKGHRITNLII